MEQYAPIFHDNALDAAVLPALTDAHLKELGLPLGHRLKLLQAIASLRDTAAPAPSEPAAPPQPSPSSAERRQVTVMFCDLVGSTALSARLDPEDLREVIGRYQACVAETVGRFDGFVAKYMGDGVLVYFGYPHAHEDDVEQAVRAGLALIDAIGALTPTLSQGEREKKPSPSGRGLGEGRLQVRIGIATGIVVVGDLIGAGSAQEQAIVGETPNLAARLQALAERIAAEPHIRLRYFCSPHQQDSALYPVIAQMGARGRLRARGYAGGKGCEVCTRCWRPARRPTNCNPRTFWAVTRRTPYGMRTSNLGGGLSLRFCLPDAAPMRFVAWRARARGAAMDCWLGTSGDVRLDKGAAILERMVSRKTTCVRRLGGTRSGELAGGALPRQPEGDGGENHRGLERPHDCGGGRAARAGDPGYDRSAGSGHGAAPPWPRPDRTRQHLRRAGACDAGGGCGQRRLPRAGRRTGLDPVGRGCDGASGAAGGGARVGPWLTVAEQAKAVLASAGMVTVIDDREGDIYAKWASVPTPSCHLLTRASGDRRLAGGGTLFAAAADFAVAGRRTIELPTSEPGRPKRSAMLELRHGEVAIRCPGG